MRIAYFDAFSGIAGDMTLGALVDLGLPLEVIQEQIHKLRLPDVEIRIREVQKNGIRALKADVWIGGEKEAAGEPHSIAALPGKHSHHRHSSPHTHAPHHSYREICARITSANLGAETEERALSVFRALAIAEGRVHGKPPDEVQFHEVGAFDAIVDIVGVAAGLTYLGVEKLFVSPVPLGSGFVRTDHGRVPVPAPATLELLRGHPTIPQDGDQELVTPTGAALIHALATHDTPPPLRTLQIGYGAGDLDFSDRPNLLRILLAEPATTRRPAGLPSLDPAIQSDEAFVLEANIDDMNPEFFESAVESLFRSGALDVALQPQTMKGGRPGTCISVIAALEKRDELERILLQETSTIGVRSWPVSRKILAREQRLIPTKYGMIAIKIVSLPSGEQRITPEYSDCRQAAREHQVPVAEVYAAAIQSAQTTTQ